MKPAVWETLCLAADLHPSWSLLGGCLFQFNYQVGQICVFCLAETFEPEKQCVGAFLYMVSICSVIPNAFASEGYREKLL